MAIVTPSTASEKDLEALLRYSCQLQFGGEFSLWKHHADEYTGAGHPDFYGHLRGMFVALELKVSPNRFTEAQAVKLRMIEASQALAFGLLHDRKEDKYYLIPPSTVQAFSYRESARANWIPVLVRDVPLRSGGTKRALDLSILDQFVRIRIHQLFQQLQVKRGYDV